MFPALLLLNGVLLQMALTHESITLERLAKVVPFYERLELETLVVDICKQLSIKVSGLPSFALFLHPTTDLSSRLQIQIDHHNSCVLFGSRGSGLTDAFKEQTQVCWLGLWLLTAV